MKPNHLWIPALLLAFVAMFSLTTLALSQAGPDSRPDGSTAGDLGSDSQPLGPPQVFIPDQFKAPADTAATAAAAASVYFTPQDENTSTTVLFLFNTGNVTGTVGIQTFQLDGSTFISTNVNVPPNGLVRIAADPVSSISTTWQDVVVINFTTFSTYGRMTLPADVKAEGFVVWNNATTYDPLQVAPTLPLRFSVDPPTVFLPTLQKK